MAGFDMFGLDRERKIRGSRVRDVFTPHQPIQSDELFFGRHEKVQRLIEHINTPGQHALLYGDRGVGKSSLANVASRLLLSHLIQGELYIKRCDSSTTFADIIAEPLQRAGVDLSITELGRTTKGGGKGAVKVGIFEAGLDGSHERSEKRRGHGGTISASDAAAALAPLKGLLLVDEADAIASDQDKKRLAELIKLLSDSGSAFKVLVVGIADTAAQLTGGHPSVQRCLKETKLDRMSDAELASIVTGGASKVGLHFTPEAVKTIVRLSAGYPHFTHLLALKCAEEAVANDSKTIGKDDLRQAVKLAVDDAEGTLRRVFEDAVRSYGTDMYKHILIAAASIPEPEFTAEELRAAIQLTTGDAMTQPALNNYLKKLVSENSNTVLRRRAKGVYAFSDPRMPSFVKIACGIVD